jgi:hypothetical protein
VDRILDHRVTDDKVTLYKVRWKNQSAEFDSWLRHEDFIDYGPIQAYVKKDKRNSNSRPKRSVNFDDNEQAHSVNSQRLAQSVSTPSILKSRAQPEEPVVMALDKDQTDAVGSYWRTMSASRRRAVPTSSDKDTDEPEAPDNSV